MRAQGWEKGKGGESHVEGLVWGRSGGGEGGEGVHRESRTWWGRRRWGNWSRVGSWGKRGLRKNQRKKKSRPLERREKRGHWRGGNGAHRERQEEGVQEEKGAQERREVWSPPQGEKNDDGKENGGEPRGQKSEDGGVERFGEQRKGLGKSESAQLSPGRGC